MKQRDQELLDFIFSKDSTAIHRVAFFEFDFLSWLLFHFPGEFDHAMANFQIEYCETLEDGMDVFFVGFRECAKSMILTYYYVWVICYKKRRFIMHYNSEMEQAKAMLIDVIGILQETESITKDYGHLYLPPWVVKKWNSKPKTRPEFITENGIKMKAMSLWKSPRGAKFVYKWVTYRPDLAGFDDIDNLGNTENPKIILKDVNFILWEVMWGMSRAQRIFLWNVIKEDGRIPRLKKHFEGNPKIKVFWIPIRIKGIIQWKRFVATDKEAEEKNRGVTNSREEVISLETLRRDQGSINFSQNFNLIAYKSWQAIISKTNIKYRYDRPQKVYTVMGIDPAYSEKTLSDPIGIAITHHYTTPEQKKIKYIEDVWELRESEKNYEKFVSFVCEKYRLHGVNVIRIEINNGGGILAWMLKAKWLAVIEVDQKKDKIQNMLENQGAYERGEVYLRAGMDSKFEEQLLGFPNTENDDMVDASNLSFKEEKMWGFTTSVKK